jgi:hypothetical protein
LRNTDLLFITNKTNIKNRIESICSDFNFQKKHYESVDKNFDDDNNPTPKLIFLSCVDSEQNDSPGNMIQVLRQLYSDAFIIAILKDDQLGEGSNYAKKCGANSVFLEKEIFSTSKFEFFASQIIKSSFLPIKVNELKPDAMLNFDLYHLLPHRGKFMRFGFAGDILPTNKFVKLNEIGEVYIKREDVDAYKNYVILHTDRSEIGLSQLCRAQFLSLYANYNDMILHLTDQSEYSSFKKGNDFLEKCKTLSAELLSNLKNLGSPYEIINNSSIGDFGSVERAPAIAAYAGLFALSCESSGCSVEDTMLGALISDLGLLFVSPKTSKKIRDKKEHLLTEEEKLEYFNHPLKSINAVLDRKLPLHDKLRTVISCTHKHIDGSGFPHQVVKRVPHSSQLIQIAESIDKNSLITLGNFKPKIKEVMKQIINESLQSEHFDKKIIEKLLHD